MEEIKPVKRTVLFFGVAALALSACASETPQEKHEVGCMAGTLGGAVVGGLIGSAFGGGVGKSLMTAAGAGAGAAAGTKLACE
jgi:uncharacterized protein YcfJ